MNESFWYMEAADEERLKELCRVLRSAYEVRWPDEPPAVEVSMQAGQMLPVHALTPASCQPALILLLWAYCSACRGTPGWGIIWLAGGSGSRMRGERP
jgi:hypothetical protein